MRRIRLETILDAPPDRVWDAVQLCSTMSFVMRGLIGVGKMPARFLAGESVVVRLWFFHVFPAWKHTIAIEAVDDSARTLRTRERGGLVARWDHRIGVSPSTGGRTHYSDEIEIEAGHFTPLVAAWAHIQFRYRHARWRRLAARLGA